MASSAVSVHQACAHRAVLMRCTAPAQEQERILAARQQRQARLAATQAANRSDEQARARHWKGQYAAAWPCQPPFIAAALVLHHESLVPALQEEDQEGMRRRQPKFGEPGFRFHAAIPQVRWTTRPSQLCKHRVHHRLCSLAPSRPRGRRRRPPRSTTSRHPAASLRCPRRRARAAKARTSTS